MDQGLYDEVVSMIRGCIISNKANMTVRQLENDFRTLTGDSIPYRRLKFSSVEELIRSVSSLYIIQMGDSYFVKAQATEKSKHIQDMVSKQNTKQKRNIRQVPTANYQYQQQSNILRWRPNTGSNRWNNTSTRSQHVWHTQNLNRQNSRPNNHSHNNQYPKPYSPQPPNSSNQKNYPPLTRQSSQPSSQQFSRPATDDNSWDAPAPAGKQVAAAQPAPPKSQSVPPPHNKSAPPQGQSVPPTQNKSAPSQGQKAPPQSQPSSKPHQHSLKTSSSNTQRQEESRNSHQHRPSNQQRFRVHWPAAAPAHESISSRLNKREPAAKARTPSPPKRPPSAKAPAAPAPVPEKRSSPPPLAKEYVFVRTDDPCADLKRFAAMHKLGEVNVSKKEFPFKNKGDRMFSCKIDVNKSSYHSYPKEFKDPLEAERYCASQALDSLVPKHTQRRSYLLSEAEDVLARIPPMLEPFVHGVWSWQLEVDYVARWAELLPADWLKIVDSNAIIELEKCGERYILRHCKAKNSFQTNSDGAVATPPNTVHFSSDKRLVAMVTHTPSAAEIWCRQADTPQAESFVKMANKMAAYYTRYHQTLKADEVVIGEHYVVESDDSWHRVRVIAITGDKICCFFIDFGDETELTVDSIYKIQGEFAGHQAQAFVCRLAGLEDLYEASINSEAVRSLYGKQVIVELDGDADVEENFNSNSNEQSLPVVLYKSPTGECINEQLIYMLGMETANPNLSADVLNEVYATYIDAAGFVYVQKRNFGYDRLQSLILVFEERLKGGTLDVKKEPEICRSACDNKLFLVFNHTKSKWMRIKFVDWLQNNAYAQVLFIDYGYMEVLNTQKEAIYSLEKYSDILKSYPAQTIKVRLALHTKTLNFKSTVSTFVKEDTMLLLRIKKHDGKSVPMVELFAYNDDNMLFCINRSVDMASSAIATQPGNAKKDEHKKSIFQTGNVPSVGTLLKPPLPNREELFKVRISFAVNPCNFYVQPLKSQAKLQQLMEKMQTMYGKDEVVRHSPLGTDDIIPGQIYASQHEDGMWYRTSVIKVINMGSISVYYCDFGYYSNLTVSQLVQLDAEFLQLPYQALNARLSGIKPKQLKWTVSDCEYFKQRVEKKVMYCGVKAVLKDELYKEDTVLELYLIDTTTDEDIVIGEELIRMNIAIQA